MIKWLQHFWRSKQTIAPHHPQEYEWLRKQQEQLRKQQNCQHLQTQKKQAGLVTDRLYHCRPLIADECTACGALFSPELPKIKGVKPPLHLYPLVTEKIQ